VADQLVGGLGPDERAAALVPTVDALISGGRYGSTAR
jgi:hypothetical protein